MIKRSRRDVPEAAGEQFTEPARIPERRVVHDEPEVVPDELPVEPLPEHRCGEQPKEG